MRRALVLLAVACAAPSAPAGEARLHLEAEPAHLSPLLGGDAMATRVTMGDVYEPLFRVGDGGALEMVLATSLVRSPDDREWTFTLRPGVTWHDGRPFVVGDVVATLRRVGPGGQPTAFSADLDDLAAVEALDARAVRLRFGGVRAGRADNLARIPILPAHLDPEATLRAPVGTGPFRFERWEPGREIVLGRFAGYWGRPARLGRVVYRIVPDRAQALAQLKSGQLDLLASVTATELADPGAARPLSYVTTSFSAITWNMRRAPLGDPRVRRALGYLLDRETIAREVLGGRARLLSGPWLPDDPASDPTVPPPTYDPAKARALLAEAGVPAPKVTLLYPATSRQGERILTVWQADAARVGVTLALEPAPYPDVLRRAAAGDFDGVYLSWTCEREQDFYHSFHSTQTDAFNYGAFADPETDELLEQIRVTVDDQPRRELEHRLHRRFADLQPRAILFGDVRTALVSPRLRGVEIGALGAPARRMEVVPEQR